MAFVLTRQITVDRVLAYQLLATWVVHPALLAYSLLSLLHLRWAYLLCRLGFASSLLAVRYAVTCQKL